MEFYVYSFRDIFKHISLFKKQTHMDRNRLRPINENPSTHTDNNEIADRQMRTELHMIEP